MSGEDATNSQNLRPPMAELDPDTMEYATRLLTTPEAVEGFISGYAARQSIDAAIEGGEVIPTQGPAIEESITEAQAWLQNIKDGTFNPVNDKTDAKGSFAKQIDALQEAGHDLSDITWQGLVVSPEWSEETLKGYIAGLCGGSSLPTSTLRKKLIAGQEVPQAIVKNESISLDNFLETLGMLSMLAHKAKEDRAPDFQVPGWAVGRAPRDFGLRNELRRRFDEATVPLFDMSGEIKTVIPIESRPVAAYASEDADRGIAETEGGEGEEAQTASVAEDVGGVALEGAAGTEAVRSDAVVEVTEAPKEFKKPELTEVFTSGQSLQKTLEDPEVDPTIKQNLHAVVRSWQEVQMAITVDEAWNEVIVPELKELDASLPELKGTAEVLSHVTEQMRAGLDRLAHAMDTRDQQGIGDAARSLGLGELMNRLDVGTNQLLQNDNVAKASQRLHDKTEGSGDLIKRSLVRSLGPLDEEDLDALTGQVGPLIEKGLDLPQAIAAIKEDMPDQSVAGWRQRQDHIEIVTKFASLAGANDELSGPFVRLKRELELFSANMRQGNYDPAQIMSVRNTHLRAVQDEVFAIQRMAVQAQAYRES